MYAEVSDTLHGGIVLLLLLLEYDIYTVIYTILKTHIDKCIHIYESYTSPYH